MSLYGLPKSTLVELERASLNRSFVCGINGAHTPQKQPSAKTITFILDILGTKLNPRQVMFLDYRKRVYLETHFAD
jgi:hypothetical protein